MRDSANLAAHMPIVIDAQPIVIEVDDSGTTFGGGYPGFLGESVGESAQAPYAYSGGEVIESGAPGLDDDSSGINPLSMLRSNSLGKIANPEYTGEPGRTNRLAADFAGPATATVVESFAMNGARIRPGRPDLAKGGPVGASNDLGQYLAVAMAQSATDFPSQELSQLNVLMAL
jgi:hypothetical protein